MVDDATLLPTLPATVVRHLGLQRGWRGRFGPVRLTIRGRSCTTDVTESLDGSPVVVGSPVLLQLDWVIAREAGKLIGNPAHGGEQVYELY